MRELQKTDFFVNLGGNLRIIVISCKKVDGFTANIRFVA